MNFSYIIENNEKDLEINEMMQIITIIHNYVKDQKFSYIDCLLNLINDKSSASVIVAILRSSSGSRNKLTNWHSTLKRSRQILDARPNKEESTDSILAGLE